MANSINSINNELDIIYKFILLGDSKVGKTCIFKKIINNKFDRYNVMTTGIDNKSIKYEIEIEENGKKIKKKSKIKIYDSAGQERFRTITKNYINKSNGIIMIYDITNKNSFNNIANGWIKNIEEGYGKCEEIKTCILLIGNKNDLVEGEEGEKLREVKTDDAKNLAEKYGFIWGGECSAKNFTKKQFDEIIIKFAQIIFSKFGYEEPDNESFELNKNVIKIGKIEKKKCQC